MAESIFDLSICILTRNQPLLLPQCVASCLAEIERAKVTAEIIVVDNASADRYPEKLLTLSPSIRVLRNEQNAGFSAGNNQAIRASRGRYVLILNDDAILQEGSVGLMFQTLDSDSSLAALGPKLVNSDGSPQEDFMYLRFPRMRRVLCEHLLLASIFFKNRVTRSLFALDQNPKTCLEPDWVAGACILARREALDSVGLFDEGFYYLFEDADLCCRFRTTGWRIAFVEAAKVIHYKSASYGKWVDSEKKANLLRSTTYFFKKHSSPAKYFLVRLTLGGALLLRIPFFVVRCIAGGGSRKEVNGRVRFNLKLLRSVLWEWR